MKVTTYKRTVTRERQVDSVKVVNDIVAARVTTTETEYGYHPPQSRSFECLTSASRLRAIRTEFDDPKPHECNWYKQDRIAMLVDLDFREYARRNPWGSKEFMNRLCGFSDPFTRITNGEASAENIILCDASSHMIYDQHNEPLPIAMWFSYMCGNMDCSHYDLVRAVEILRARDDVLWATIDRDGAINPLPAPPYTERKLAIEFAWTPSVEDYRRMVAQCETYGSRYPSTQRFRAMFDLDLLGLRAGGAAKYSQFSDCDEYQSSDEG